MLWLAVLAVFAAISATLLLANDKRNLRAVFQYYQLEWPFPEKQKIVLRRDPKTKRLPVRPFTIPGRFFTVNDPAILGTFLRQIDIPGPDLCTLLSEAGIGNDGWKASEFDRNTFECLSERQIGAPDDPASLASLFLSMKGTAAGIVTNMRLKVIMPPTPDGERIRVDFVKAFRIIMEKTRWLDFSEDVEKVTRLENVDVTRFGVNLKFSAEFTNNRRFNLILSFVGADRALARTRGFFDHGAWALRTADGLLSTPQQLYDVDEKIALRMVCQPASLSSSSAGSPAAAAANASAACSDSGLEKR